MTNSPDLPNSEPTITEPAVPAVAPRAEAGAPAFGTAPARADAVPAGPDAVGTGPDAAGPDGAGPDAAGPVAVQTGPDAVLDAATFDRILEPRSPRRLPLGDGTWHQLARSYVWVRLISLALFLVVVVVAASVLALITRTAWPWIPGGVLAVGILWAAVITPRQARAFGYQLRADDLVFRRGILWQRMVAVPYGRMQLVDITHGPLDRAFGIAQLKLVTAAAATGVVIPGLTQEAAEQLRDTLVDVAEARRTGL